MQHVQTEVVLLSSGSRLDYHTILSRAGRPLALTAVHVEVVDRRPSRQGPRQASPAGTFFCACVELQCDDVFVPRRMPGARTGSRGTKEFSAVGKYKDYINVRGGPAPQPLPRAPRQGRHARAAGAPATEKTSDRHPSLHDTCGIVNIRIHAPLSSWEAPRLELACVGSSLHLPI